MLKDRARASWLSRADLGTRMGLEGDLRRPTVDLRIVPSRPREGKGSLISRRPRSMAVLVLILGESRVGT